MRLNWFSPLPPERTDIAHYTARIAPALMRRFDVVFWTDLRSDPDALPRHAQVRRFDPEALNGRALMSELLTRVNVYHFGNDARFHAGIFRAARLVPGVAVLHDTRLHHFVFELFRATQWAGYLDLARAIYGPTGLAKAREIIAAQGQTIDAIVAEMPFLEAVTDRSAAVICHSQDALREVRERSTIPALVLPLPFASLAGAVDIARPWAPKWRFVMFGYVNPNRRLESVLRALARLPTDIDYQFDVYGTLWDQSRIEKLIGACGLGARVKLHGFVAERELDAAIAAAHLAFNLRSPTMGEASGGILRSWSHATPALVTNEGWYAGLPDNIAPKISSDNEIEEIGAVIAQLIGDPARFKTMGLAARQYVEAQHAPDVYAARLVDGLANFSEALTRVAALRMLERVALTGRSPSERKTLLERATQLTPPLLARL